MMYMKLPCLLILSIFIVSAPAFALANKPAILVHPFKNTGEKAFDWLAAGLNDSVIADLNRVSGVTVFSEQDREKALRELSLQKSGLVADDTVVTVGKLLGANVIFTGSYMVMGKKLRVIARLISVETGRTERSVKIDGTLEDIFNMQDRIVQKLLTEAKQIDIKQTRPVEVTRSDWIRIKNKYRPQQSAFELHAKARQAQYTEPVRAVALYNQAHKISPDYAESLIHAAHVEAELLNRFEEARDLLDRAQAAIGRRGEKGGILEAQLHFARGNLFGRTGEYDRSLAEYEKARDMYAALEQTESADYATLIMNMGLMHNFQGRFDRALEFFRLSDNLRKRSRMELLEQAERICLAIGNAQGAQTVRQMLDSLKEQ